MSEQNPYSTPQASLDSEQQQQFYQPRLFSANGRIGRLRYLAYSTGINLLLMIVMVPIMTFSGMGAGEPPAEAASPPVFVLLLTGLFYIATIVFAILFSKRRLNDLNRSGWWFLLFFVPIANIALAIYLIFFAGSEETNDFGPVPVENTLGVKILGLLLPIIALVGIIAAIAIPSYVNYADKAQQIQQQ